MLVFSQEMDYPTTHVRLHVTNTPYIGTDTHEIHDSALILYMDGHFPNGGTVLNAEFHCRFPCKTKFTI